MTNDGRNAMIEEARRAIHGAIPGSGDYDDWVEAIPHGLDMLGDIARAALAVFEKARTPKVIERHDLVMPIYEDEDTPTDDEREAMAHEAWCEYQAEHGYLTHPTQPDTGADFYAGFEAGFRRSEVPEPSADMIASEDGMTLEELGNAMLSASDQWDGDESMHSIVYRFIEHYAELDAEIHAAREAVDFEDDVEILFRWDWESGTLKRVEASEPQDEPSDASTCDHCGGEAWHHTVECFTGAKPLQEAISRLENCLSNRDAGIGAWSMVQPEDVRTVLSALRAAGVVR